MPLAVACKTQADGTRKVPAIFERECELQSMVRDAVTPWPERTCKFMNNCRCLACLLCFLVSLATHADEPPTSELPSVELTSIDGEVISFADAKLRVYCMLGTECPVSRFYAVRLDEIAKQFARDGVRFVGVHCNLHDSEADVRRFVKELGVSFPQVRDATQAIARQLKATIQKYRKIVGFHQRRSYRAIQRSCITRSYLCDLQMASIFPASVG